MTDQQFQQMAHDVRQIRKVQLRPAQLGVGCMIAAAAVPVTLFCIALLTRLMSAIWHFLLW